MSKRTRVRVTINKSAINGLTARKIRGGLRTAGVVGEAAVKTEFQGAKSGKTYTRGSKTHTSSAPGQSPAVDTGTLRRSVGHEVLASAQGGRATVFANTEYALALEEGKGKLKGPRPFVSTLGTKYLSRIRAAFIRGAKSA